MISASVQTSSLHACGRISERLESEEDLERLYEGPQQDTDGVALPQQLDQASRSEKLQEAHVDGVHRLGRPSQREGGWGWGGRGRGGVAEGNRDRQEVKHRWQKSSQGDFGCIWEAGTVAPGETCREKFLEACDLCLGLMLLWLLFFVSRSRRCQGVSVCLQLLTCKSTIISVMLPRTVMKSKIFQVSRK